MAKLERERSSGGIIAKVGRSGIKILLIRDPYGKWTWPKGKIDKGETLLEAAKREIFEEVGLKKIELISKIEKTNYFYKRDGKVIFKTVYLYLFKLTGPDRLSIQKREIEDGKWFDEKRTYLKLGYKGAKNIMAHAISILKISA